MSEKTSVVSDFAQPYWRILLVEDDEQVRRDVHEEFEGAEFGGRRLSIVDVPDFDQALNEIRQRQVDLIVLDVFRGNPMQGGETAGLRVLKSIRETGFVSVILYTAQPEKVEDEKRPFVRLVGKDIDGLQNLRKEIAELFQLRVPQTYRAIVGHLDRTLRDYMWGFVEKNWQELSELASHQEFARIVVQRLATSLAREGINNILEELFGSQDGGRCAPDTVHPAEFFIMPPVAPENPRLGDIRVTKLGGVETFLVVLWPTCDMVVKPGRDAKVERIHCAVASLLKDTPEIKEWLANQSPSKSKSTAVEDLLGNNRKGKGIDRDRFHVFPGLCNLPDLLVDFQKVERFDLSEVRNMTPIATLASPFSESLSARYLRYIGRLGTPDLDVELVMRRLQATAKSDGK